MNSKTEDGFKQSAADSMVGISCQKSELDQVPKILTCKDSNHLRLSSPDDTARVRLFEFESNEPEATRPTYL
jgi:hypothetical protein